MTPIYSSHLNIYKITHAPKGLYKYIIASVDKESFHTSMIAKKRKDLLDKTKN